MKLMKDWDVDPFMMKATAKRLNAIAQYDLEDYLGENLHPEDSQSICEVMDQIGIKRGIGLH